MMASLVKEIAMNKHCRGCIMHHSAGRRNPPKELKKYNDWCIARGAPVNVGWCLTHKSKKEAVK